MKKLRVVHFPQIPCNTFIVEVKDENSDGNPGWCDYYNEEENLEYVELNFN